MDMGYNAAAIGTAAVAVDKVGAVAAARIARTAQYASELIGFQRHHELLNIVLRSARVR